MAKPAQGPYGSVKILKRSPKKKATANSKALAAKRKAMTKNPYPK
jgi:hypothetical protein